MKKYVAFDPAYGEYSTFDTLEEAKSWLIDIGLGDPRDCDPIPEEYINGEAWIAEIKYRSKYKITDRKENYPCSEDGESDWPYDDGYDVVGDLLMVDDFDRETISLGPVIQLEELGVDFEVMEETGEAEVSY